MSGDDTVVSLKQHLEDLINALDMRIEQRLTYIEKTIEKSLDLLSARIESLYSFREEFEEQSQQFITKLEYRAAHDALVSQFNTVVRLVYVGLGLSMALGYFVKMLVDHITK